MIVARFDLDRMASATDRRATMDATGTVKAEGLLIEAADADARFTDGDLVVVVRGTPRGIPTGPGSPAAEEAAEGIARALRADPIAALNRLHGRFAILWFDTRSSTGGFATDRFATHSLCHSVSGGRGIVAERAEGAINPPGEIDPQAIFNYLHFHCIPAPLTIFRGVRRLEQGRMLRCGPGTAEERAWWTPRFIEDGPADFDRLREEFRTILRSSVGEALESGRVAAFLSGGTDSSTVVGMMREVTGQSPRGYSIGFDAEGYDEMEYARIAARAFGVDHREYYVTPADLVTGIPQVAAWYDQPFGNSSAVPAYYLAKLARADGFDTLLAGDGGDELFGGNARYAKQRVFGWYEMLPAALRESVLQPLLLGVPGIRRVPVLSKAASYVEQASVPMPDRLEMYNLLVRITHARLFDPSFLASIDPSDPAARQRIAWHSAQAGTPINRNLAFDWKFTLADNDLPKVTGTTALAGIGVRFPLLHEDLVDFSLRLPPSYKLRGTKLRWFFKEALRGFLPGEILTKKKHGFGLPFGHWVLKDGALGRLVDDSLSGIAARGLLREGFAGTLRSSLLPEAPGYYGELIWVLMMLEQWLRSRADTVTVPAVHPERPATG
ncbi:MAG: asparagine synthase C-terminal domain-containing protein [Betaproteobacteria bacterium]